MTSIDLLLDPVDGSACPESINLGGTGLWNFQDCNHWSFPTVLEFGSGNMTAHKLHRLERSDNRVRELASRLSLDEQVCSDFPILHLFFPTDLADSNVNIELDYSCYLPYFLPCRSCFK
jgi:hypothetical protein